MASPFFEDFSVEVWTFIAGKAPSQFYDWGEGNHLENLLSIGEQNHQIFADRTGALVAIGCGNSDDFVFTNNNNINNNNGNVVFSFARAQGVLTLPLATANLDISFFNGGLQGTRTLNTMVPFANTVTVPNVPPNSDTFLVTARDANGLPLFTSSNGITVPIGQTVNANFITSVNNAVNLTGINIAPDNQTIGVTATQQFSAVGSFSNGENLPVTGVTWNTVDGSIATIDANGLATGVGGGTTQVNGALGGFNDATNLTVGGVVVQTAIFSFQQRTNQHGQSGHL